MKESFRIHDLSEVERNAQLRDYLTTSNFTLTEMASGAMLTAHLAHYPQTSLVTVSTPRVTIRWKRDEASRARGLMIFARKGEVDAKSESPVIRRGRSAILVPPGDSSIEIRATGESNELIYVSAGAHVIPPSATNLRKDVQADPLPWRVIAPLYGFVHGLCVTPQPALDEPDLLAPAAAVVVEALARTAFWDISPMESIVRRAQAFIDDNHGNPLVNACAVSEHLKVSQRTLQAAFAAEGLTVSAELRRARTATAVRLKQTHPSMPQAYRAHLAGFASQSALYRALRADAETSDGALGAVTYQQPPDSPTRPGPH